MYRGGNALRYGAANLGGAINFVSPSGHTAPLFGARAEFGSFDYFRAQGSHAQVIGPWDYYFSGSHFATNGFREHAERDLQRFHINFGYRISENIENRTYLIAGRGGKELAAGLTKEGAEEDPTQDTDSPPFMGRNPQDLFLNLRDERYTLLFANKTAIVRGDQAMTATVFARSYDLFHPLGNGPFFHTIFDIERHSFGTRLTYDNAAPLFGHRNRFSAGFDVQGSIENTEQHDNQSGTRGPVTGDDTSTAYNYALYFEDQYYLMEPLALIAGLHAMHTTREVEDGFLGDNPLFDVMADDSFSENFTTASPKIGLVYDLDPESNLYLTFTRSYEPPTFIELRNQSGPADFTIVDAQEGSTIEAGTRGEIPGLSWDFAVYHTWVDDELLPQTDLDGNDIGTLNLDDTRHLGVEIGFDTGLLGPEGLLYRTRAIAGGRIRLRLAYHMQDFDIDDDPVFGDNDIPGIPEHFLRSEFLYEHPSGFYLGPNLEWIPRAYPVDLANTDFVDPFAMLGIKVGYRPQQGFGVFFEGRNLTDKEHVSSANIVADARTGFGPPRIFFPGDGVAFYGGVEWRW
ncbi:MAG: TonB-dependent receptor family protein [Gammaproteobacteria bacterium]